MRKIFSVSFVAITLLSLAMPVSVNADEVGFQNDALTMPITESFPNSGSIVFDENGNEIKNKEQKQYQFLVVGLLLMEAIKICPIFLLWKS